MTFLESALFLFLESFRQSIHKASVILGAMGQVFDDLVIVASLESNGKFSFPANRSKLDGERNCHLSGVPGDPCTTFPTEPPGKLSVSEETFCPLNCCSTDTATRVVKKLPSEEAIVLDSVTRPRTMTSACLATSSNVSVWAVLLAHAASLSKRAENSTTYVIARQVIKKE